MDAKRGRTPTFRPGGRSPADRRLRTATPSRPRPPKWRWPGRVYERIKNIGPFKANSHRPDLKIIFWRTRPHYGRGRAEGAGWDLWAQLHVFSTAALFSDLGPVSRSAAEIRIPVQIFRLPRPSYPRRALQIHNCPRLPLHAFSFRVVANQDCHHREFS